MKALDIYRTMYRIRTFETALGDLFAKGLMKGTTHLSIGQESCSAGVCSALEEGDLVVSTHRGHGHYISLGGNINRLMAEFFGKEEGLCGGRGGSQHIFDPSVGFLGANGITGGGLPIGLGAAFSMKYRNLPNIVCVFIGEGASNQGTFHEVLNIASVRDLPLLVVVENNDYAMFTHRRVTTSVERVSVRAGGYGIEGRTIGHGDALAVHDTVRGIRSAMVERSRPYLLEIMTYRLCGHSKSDDCSYRPREEDEARRAEDPLSGIRLRAVEEAGESAVEEIEKEETSRVDGAIRFAEEGKEPAS